MWFLRFLYGENLHKVIVFVLNFCILVFAITLIATATSLKTTTTGVEIKEVSDFGIALGVIIAVVAISGCWGVVVKENSCYLCVYAGVLLTFFCIQIPFVILTFLLDTRSPIEKVVNKRLINIYQQRCDEEHLKRIHDFQQTLNCCGYLGPNENQRRRINCNEMVSECTYQDTCTGKLSNIIAGDLETIGIIALFFGIFELACALFVFFVRGSRKERDDTEALL